MATLIKNGLIVTAEATFRGEIRVENGKVSEIGLRLSRRGAKIIDAAEHYVIPGGVDVHTHLNLDTGTAVARDDFYTGTVAAACGGTTCVVDHPGLGPKGCDLHHQITRYHGLARGNAVTDYGFHGVFQHVDAAILEEVKSLVEEGVPSFKAYLTYDAKIGDAGLLRILARLKELGALTAVHAESDAMIDHLRSRFLEEGRRSAIHHALSRPEICEAEAVERCIRLAAAAGDAPLYIVHLSTAAGLAAVSAARGRGQTVFAETCPQYLLLEESRYHEPDEGGLKYIMAPPLRPAENREALWRGLRNDDIQVVATDHCSFDFETKRAMGRDDFSKCPGGIPGIEPRVPLIYSEGVVKGRISLNRFVEVVATAPAKIMGLFPRKGTLLPGSDADLVLLDPRREVTITHADLHENVDYTPYEGLKVRGWPALTMVRGEVVVEEGRFVGRRGGGRFVKRGPFSGH